MNIADSLREISVADLDLTRYVPVAPSIPVGETVSRMNSAGWSCAFVEEEEGSLVGVFTQRDIVSKVVGIEGACDSAVEEMMSPAPRHVTGDTSVSDALAVMTELWVRNLPVVDGETVVGNFSYYTVMKLIGDLLAQKAARTESDLSAQHGLMFVDFSGLRTEAPVTVAATDPLEAVIHQMRARGMGSVLVVNERESLVGVVTEFDLQTKVACTSLDLDATEVGQVMMPHPVALDARAPISEAIAGMTNHEISHVALVAETGRPVGMVTFQDVTDYFDTSLEALS